MMNEPQSEIPSSHERRSPLAGMRTSHEPSRQFTAPVAEIRISSGALRPRRQMFSAHSRVLCMYTLDQASPASPSRVTLAGTLHHQLAGDFRSIFGTLPDASRYGMIAYGRTMIIYGPFPVPVMDAFRHHKKHLSVYPYSIENIFPYIIWMLPPMARKYHQ
jgi:hypothetical protein